MNTLHYLSSAISHSNGLLPGNDNFSQGLEHGNLHQWASRIQRQPFSIAQTTSRQFKTYSTDDTPALEQFSKGQEGSHLCHG